jgi:hypothetical protein
MSDHTCLICGGPAVYDTVGFGYGSEFDSEYICKECCKKWIDPVVKKAIVANEPAVDEPEAVA